MLQFLPVGGALMAERYTYIPYIGLFMIIGKGYVYSQENKSKFAQNIKWLYTTIIVAGIIAFSVLSFQRIKVWKDGETLFTDVIKKYPNLPFAYNNRGYLYYNFMRKYDKSLADYNKCISLDSTFHRAYSNRGVLYYNTGRLDLAVKDFTKAIHFKNDNTDAWIGRANSYSTLKKFDLALPDYNHYISIVANDSKSYLWRGIALYNLGRFDESFTDINKCLNITTDNDNAYLWRGILFSQKKDYKAAIKGFDQSIELNSNQTEPYIWRGIARDNLKQYTAAIDDYSKGLKKCYKDTTKIFLIKDDGNSQKIDTLFNNPSSAATIFLNRSAAYFALKKYTEAFKDYCAAGDLGLALNKDYFFKLKALAGK
jgi:tetratricopeptide (TPR) repeat protein